MPRIRDVPARPSVLRSLAAAAWLGGSSALALAQEDGRTSTGGRVHELNLAASASETALVTVRRGERVDEAVTQLTPSLRWTSNAGRVRGSVSYAADLRHYEGNNKLRTDADTLDNRLSANVRAELVDNQVFVDITGALGQQSGAGASDVTSSGGSLYQPGQGNESGSFSVSPYVTGSIAGLALYDLRYGYNISGTRNDGLPRRTNDSLSLSLRNQGSSRLGLSAQCSLGRSSFGTGQGQNRNDRCNGNAALRLDTDWSVNLNGGQERTNVGTLAARNYDNYGASVLWTPSPRTRFELGADKRYFGNGHRLVLEHRTPRTIWRYSDVRDVNNGDTFGNGRSITLFQLFYAQFASIQPDPALRDQLVRQYLAAIGRSPDELLNVSLPGGGTTVQRRRDLSVAWTGLRMTVTVLAYSSESRFLGGPNTGPSTASAGSNSSQSGGTVSSSYRLTPLTSLTAALSRSITPDAARTGSGTGLKAATLSLSTQLGARTTASLSGRYSVLNGGADPYREAALTATLSLRF